MSRNRFFKFILWGMVLLSFPSCNGIFSSIYDDPIVDDTARYGFVKYDSINHRGTIYIDATSYMRWVYLDFHNRRTDTLNIQTENIEPSKWDIAIHRYDVKTNNGSVLETDYSDLGALIESENIPSGNYVTDVEGQIMIDISDMINGNIVYAQSDINEELSKWLDVDTTNMPPTYTLSNRVYVLNLQDSTYAAIKFLNFMDEALNKGFITIDYIYPLDFSK